MCFRCHFEMPGKRNTWQKNEIGFALFQISQIRFAYFIDPVDPLEKFLVEIQIIFENISDKLAKTGIKDRNRSNESRL